MNFSFLSIYWKFFLKGTQITILLSIFAVFFGILLGIVIVLIRRSRILPLRWLGNVYVEFIRGTPLLAQIYIVYIGIPTLFSGFDRSREESWYEFEDDDEGCYPATGI